VKLADQIRRHVLEEYIRPSRRGGRRQITIRAGDVHRSMELENRMPAVCSALDAAEFYEEAGVTLIQRSGPLQSSTVEWSLRLEPAGEEALSMVKIREVNVERDEAGNYKQVQLAFGPHYFVELVTEEGGVNLYVGATHHGFKADASEVNGELERFIYEIRERHPENAFD